MSQFPFRPTQNAEAAQFIIDGISDFAVDLNSIIPRGFDAYVRLFHPATFVKDGIETKVRWSDVAQSIGRTVHPKMQWWQLGGQASYIDRDDIEVADGSWYKSPREGSMPFEVAQALWKLLRGYTDTPEDCTFAIWEGWGGLAQFVREAPAFELPHRKFHLFEAPIQTIEKTFESYDGDTHYRKIISDTGTARLSTEEINEMLSESPRFYQSANLWWPADESWCVATEIDFDSTYVAGSQKVIDEITSRDYLEVYQLKPTESLWDK